MPDQPNKNSKNTINNSTIHVNGDFHLGDNHTTFDSKSSTETGITKAELAKLRKLVIAGNLEEVLSWLSGKTIHHEEYATEVTQLQKRLNILKREERMGLIAYETRNLESNRITNSVLSLMNKLSH